MPSSDDFKRVDLGNREPHFQGTASQQGVYIPDTYQRVDTARNSDPSANLSSSNYRGDDYRPKNLLDSQAAAVQAAIDGKIEFDALYGLQTPLAGPGVHRWLRDGREYGNQQPDGAKGIPTFREDK